MFKPIVTVLLKYAICVLPVYSQMSPLRWQGTYPLPNMWPSASLLDAYPGSQLNTETRHLVLFLEKVVKCSNYLHLFSFSIDWQLTESHLGRWLTSRATAAPTVTKQSSLSVASFGSSSPLPFQSHELQRSVKAMDSEKAREQSEEGNRDRTGE